MMSTITTRKLLGIAGSLRSDSYNKAILRTLKRVGKELRSRFLTSLPSRSTTPTRTADIRPTRCRN